MVFGSGSGGRQRPVGKPFEKPYYLFNLKNDPRERKNVIEDFPSIAERMTKILKEIMDSAGSRSVRMAGLFD